MTIKEWELRIDPAGEGVIYTFHIQPGMKWHSSFWGDFGEADADDFIFSIEDISRDDSKHPNAGQIRRVWAQAAKSA